MGKASFGGSQDLSSLFASISGDQPGGSGSGATTKSKAAPKATVVKLPTPQKIKAPTGGGGPSAAQQLQDQLDELGYQLTTKQIDEFEYASQLEALAGTTSDAGTRAKLLERAYTTRENAKVAKDKEMQGSYEAGEISDDEWLSYIKDRADTEEDPEVASQLRSTLRAEAGRISDEQAEAKFRNGGRIEDLINHYAARMATVDKDSNPYRALQVQYNKNVDIKTRNDFNKRATKLQDQLEDKKITPAQFLAEMKKMVGTARPGSQNVEDFANYVHDLERKVKDMKAQSSGGGGGGSRSSSPYSIGSGPGAASALKGDLDGPIPTFKKQVEGSRYNKLVATRINEWQAVLRAKESGAGSVTLPAILFDKHADPNEKVTVSVDSKLVATATKKIIALYDRHISVDKAVGYDTTAWTKKKADFIVASSQLHTPSQQTINHMIASTMTIIEQAGNNPDGAQGEADIIAAKLRLETFQKNQFQTSKINPQVGFTITKEKNPALAANPEDRGMVALGGLIDRLNTILSVKDPNDPVLTADDTNRFISGSISKTAAAKAGVSMPAVDVHGQPVNLAPSDQVDPVSGMIIPRDKPNGGDTWVQATVPDGKGGARLAWVPANNMTISVPVITATAKVTLSDGTEIAAGQQLTTSQAAEIAKKNGMTLTQGFNNGLFDTSKRAEYETSRVTVNGKTWTRNPFTKSWVEGDRIAGHVVDQLFNTIPGVTVQGVGAIPYWSDMGAPELRSDRASGADEAPIPELSGVPRAAQNVYNENAAIIKQDQRINGGNGFIRFDENGHPIKQSAVWEQNSIFDPVVHARFQKEISAHSRDESGAAESESDARKYQAQVMRARLEAEIADRNRKLAKISATFANDQRHGGFGTDPKGEVDSRMAAAIDPIKQGVEQFTSVLSKAFGLGDLRKPGAQEEPDTTDDRPRSPWMDWKPPSAAKQIDPPASYSGPILPRLTSMNKGTTLQGKPAPLPALKAPSLAPSGKETKVIKPPLIKPPSSQAKANTQAQKVQNSGKSAKIGPTTKVAS